MAPLADAHAATQHRAGRHPGYVRLALEWPEPMAWAFTQTGTTVEVEFVRAPELDADWIEGAFPRRVRAVSIEGTTLRLELAQPYKVTDLSVRGGHVLALDIHNRRVPMPLPSAQWVPERRPSLLPTPEPPLAEGPTGVPDTHERPGGEAPENAIATDAVEPEAPDPTSTDTIATLPPHHAEEAVADNAAIAQPDAESEAPAASEHSPEPVSVVLPELTSEITAPAAEETVTPAEPDRANGHAASEPPADVHDADDVAHAGDVHDAGDRQHASEDVELSETIPTLATTAGALEQPAPSHEAVNLPILEVAQRGDGLSFTANEAIAVAVLQRADELFVAFNLRATIVADDLADAWQLSDLGATEGTALHLQAPAGKDWRVVADGLRWIIEPTAEPLPLAPPSSEWEPVAHAIPVEDPWLGDRMWLLPQEAAGGFAGGAWTADRRWLDALQGKAWRGRPPGPEDDVKPVASHPSAGLGPGGGFENRARLIGLSDHRFREADRASRLDLQHDLADDPSMELRFDLTRHMLAEHLPEEALAVLGSAPEGSFEDAADREQAAALSLVAHVLRRDAVAAATVLQELGGAADETELALWRALAHGERRDWGLAGYDLAKSGQVWRSYAPRLQVEVAQRIADIAVELDEPSVALEVIQRARTMAPGPEADGHLEIAAIRAQLALGEDVDFSARLAALRDHPMPAIRLRANLLSQQVAGGDETTDWLEVRAGLEHDREKWRGHPEEAAFILRLAEAQRQSGAPLEALATLEEAAGLSPDEDGLLDLLERQRELVREMIGPGDQAAALPEARQALSWLDRLSFAAEEQAVLLRRLAGRIADETLALDVADHYYNQAIILAGGGELASDIRAELAELRLRRGLPDAVAGAAADEPALIKADQTTSAEAAGTESESPTGNPTLSRSGVDEPLGVRARTLLGETDALLQSLEPSSGQP